MSILGVPRADPTETANITKLSTQEELLQSGQAALVLLEFKIRFDLFNCDAVTQLS